MVTNTNVCTDHILLKIFVVLTVYAEFIISKLYDISITFYNDFNLILKENKRWLVYLIQCCI